MGFNAGSTNSCTGEIKLFPSATLPSGWLICDGSAISRVAYVGLFGVLGTTYGAGDGTTTFNLPDLRGKVVTGYDASQTEFNTLGKSGGEKTHTITLAESPAHNHINGTFQYLLESTGQNTAASTDATAGEVNLSTKGQIQSAGGGQPHNNLQPYITMHYIIKY